MKKIALLLAVCILSGTLFSCINPNNDVSTEPSNEISTNETSDTSDETSSEAEEIIQYETVVSVGKTYEYSGGKISPSYPDSYNVELTDGKQNESGSYFHESFVGYERNGGNVVFVIDLGDDGQKIYKFGVSFLCTWEAGIGPLNSASIDISDDGTEFTHIGSVSVPAFEENTVQTAWYTADKTYNARYVRITATHASNSLFLDEVTVIANRQSNAQTEEYFDKLAAVYKDSSLSEGDVALPDGKTADRSLNRYSVSYGKSYVTSIKASDKYKDEYNRALTDGTGLGASPSSANWVGYEGGKELVIDLKLGGKKQISDFEISMLAQHSLGIYLPYYVDFYTSVDGKNFTLIGRIYAPDKQTEHYVYSLMLEKEITASTVRFVCAETESKYYLCEEIGAYYYDTARREKLLYEPVVLETAGKKKYLENQSDKIINLISGMEYQVSSTVELLYENYSQSNTQASGKHLTDGKYTQTTEYGSPAWFKAHGGGYRSIYIDLGYQASVTGLKASFLAYYDIGVSHPSNATLHLSDDGISWYNVCSAVIPAPSSNPGMTMGEATLETPVEARYIRITYPVDVHVFADEIEVYGSKKVTSNTITLEELGTYSSVVGSYTDAREELLGGAADTILIGMTNVFEMDVDYFLPYTAYISTDGKIIDTMFDGFLFAPASANFLGGTNHIPSDNPNTANDWNYMLNEMFREGVYLDALNRAVAQTKQATGDSDYTVDVYFTILHAGALSKNFGDIDGDGKDDDPYTLEGIEKIYDWYMGEFIKRFNAGNYEHLEFSGFYWVEEAVIRDLPEDEKSIRLCASVAEKYGQQLFWIPYYLSNGYHGWNRYGFASACMQPNTVFRAETGYEQLLNAIAHIKEFGMGVEIEITQASLTDKVYFDKYMDYLRCGIEYGYMNDSILMYYGDADDYYVACYSDEAMARAVYDRTYEFIKDILGENKPEAKDMSFTAEAGNIFTEKLFENPDGLLSGKITVYAKHGCVTVNTDGTFTYYPNSGFTGTDTFCYSVYDGIAYSDAKTVTITVE